MKTFIVLLLCASSAMAEPLVVVLMHRPRGKAQVVTAYRHYSVSRIVQDFPVRDTTRNFSFWGIPDGTLYKKWIVSGRDSLWMIDLSPGAVKVVGDSLRVLNRDSLAIYDVRYR